MNETREMELLALLGSKGTKEILQYLCKHGKVQYKEFDLSISVPTLSKHLVKLLKFNLVDHCMTRDTKRREWYEITEKGRKILEHLEEMVKLIEE